MIKYPLIHSTWNKDEFKAINKVVKTGMFTMGKNVSEFEKKIRKISRKKIWSDGKFWIISKSCVCSFVIL